eukprot:TRINITY_DN74993_c0_g1_i1.p1 TRINITY_DN74993_c0_g1~~TRINITY_DN74993_c0_g1_i1.p1  ORF type:complete len:417 (+),score=-2.06 TRINITY_DN74993_c0_g1_i1:19-1269(+)
MIESITATPVPTAMQIAIRAHNGDHLCIVDEGTSSSTFGISATAHSDPSTWFEFVAQNDGTVAFCNSTVDSSPRYLGVDSDDCLCLATKPHFWIIEFQDTHDATITSKATLLTISKRDSQGTTWQLTNSSNPDDQQHPYQPGGEDLLVQIQLRFLPIVDISPLLQLAKGVGTRNKSLETQSLQRLIDSVSDVGAFYCIGHDLHLGIINYFETLLKADSYIEPNGQDIEKWTLQSTDGSERLGTMNFQHPAPKPDWWPQDNTTERIEQYYTQSRELGKFFNHHLCNVIGKPQIRKLLDADKIPDPVHSLVLLRYVAQDPTVNQEVVGLAEHVDKTWVTVLAQDSVGTGMQVKGTSGDYWVDCPPVEGAVIVNIGAAMEWLSDGMFKAPLHRGRNPRCGKTRVSMPMFVEPMTLLGLM